MTRTASIGLVLIAALVLSASAALASRPPTRSEEDWIELAFQNAHKDDGVSLRSIREIRVSVLDGHWAGVAYAKKGKAKKQGLDFFHRTGETKWRKGKPPGAVKSDLKKPPEPFLVDIRYQASGSFQYDDNYADGFTTYHRHADATFSWDFVWRGVELYDDHYPRIDDTPDTADVQGAWNYSYTVPTGSPAEQPCTASGPLQSAFEGLVDVERGAKEHVDVRLEWPNFNNAPSGCYDGDIWRVPAVNPRPPVLRDVPTFPSEPVSQPVSSQVDCAKGAPASETCSFGFAGTVTITP